MSLFSSLRTGIGDDRSPDLFLFLSFFLKLYLPFFFSFLPFRPHYKLFRPLNSEKGMKNGFWLGAFSPSLIQLRQVKTERERKKEWPLSIPPRAQKRTPGVFSAVLPGFSCFFFVFLTFLLPFCVGQWGGDGVRCHIDNPGIIFWLYHTSLLSTTTNLIQSHFWFRFFY